MKNIEHPSLNVVGFHHNQDFQILIRDAIDRAQTYNGTSGPIYSDVSGNAQYVAHLLAIEGKRLQIAGLVLPAGTLSTQQIGSRNIHQNPAEALVNAAAVQNIPWLMFKHDPSGIVPPVKGPLPAGTRVIAHDPEDVKGRSFEAQLQDGIVGWVLGLSLPRPSVKSI